MIGKILITLYLVVVLLVVFIGSLPILFVSYFILSQKKFAYLNETIGSIIFKIMILSKIWSFKITGGENIDPDEQYVIVANHVSFIDTFVMWQLPIYKKFIMAEKYTKIPIFGNICKACGHVFVDMNNRHTTINAVDKACETIKDGSSFAIFPEGKRSDNPNVLLPFKTGAFRIAQKANIKILPVVIRGSGKALPVGGICNFADIEMIIGEPLYIGDDYNANINTVRKFILDKLN